MTRKDGPKDALPDLVAAHGAPGEGIRTLLEAVAALDPSTVRSARVAFVRLARALTRDRLIPALGRGVEERLGAARLLLEEGSTEALDAVARLAADDIEEIRVLAALARSLLERAGERRRPTEEPEPLDGPARPLDDPNPAAVGRWAFSALRSGRFEDAAPAARTAEGIGLTDAAGALAELVHAVEAPRRREALRLVWRLAGARFLPHLAFFLTDPSGPIRVVALEILGESRDPDAFEVARSLLERDTSPAVRAAAVKVLGGAGTDERLPALARALRDPNAEVRMEAVRALGMIDDDEVTPVLITVPKDPG